jgi:hypothetical protein
MYAMAWKASSMAALAMAFLYEIIAIISKIANAVFESRFRRFRILPARAVEASTCILLKQLDIGLVYTKKSCTSAEAGEATGEDGQGDGVMLAIAAVEVGDPYKVSGEAEGVHAQIFVAFSSLS